MPLDPVAAGDATARPAETPGPTTSALVDATTAPTSEATPLGTTEPTATATATEAPTATATEPSRTAPTREPRPAPTPEPKSRLSVSFIHSLKSGQLRVFVDKDLVLEQGLSSRVTKDLLLFKQRSGRARDVLPVPPGRRHLRVEVETGGEVHSREIWAEFKPRETRRLAVGLKGDNLSLQWR
jgi:hypothetical protein